MAGDEPRYAIHDVSGWQAIGDEMMGTKPKCWLLAPDEKTKWLFKEKYRPNSEDDWSEKIASELAELLGIPHAKIELAKRHGRRGIIGRDLVADYEAEELIPGNSLLVEEDSAYPGKGFFHIAQHTIERVFRVMTSRRIGLPPGISIGPGIADANGLLTGYLMLDAWIGNTDRHHENWAVLKLRDGGYILSPSYDHASSLGHNIGDVDRQDRMTTQVRNRQVDRFVLKARSAMYRNEADTKAMTTEEAFRLACVSCPEAGLYWLGRLRTVQDAAVTDIVRRVSDGLMSDVAKSFALAMLRANRARLLTVNG